MTYYTIGEQETLVTESEYAHIAGLAMKHGVPLDHAVELVCTAYKNGGIEGSVWDALDVAGALLEAGWRK